MSTNKHQVKSFYLFTAIMSVNFYLHLGLTHKTLDYAQRHKLFISSTNLSWNKLLKHSANIKLLPFLNAP